MLVYSSYAEDKGTKAYMEKQIRTFISDSSNGNFENQAELKEFLIEEAEYRADYVEDLSEFELLDLYLRYNGIIGYTEDIINAVKAAYNMPNLSVINSL